MNWEEVSTKLTTVFSKAMIESPDGNVYVPSESFDLNKALFEAASADEKEYFESFFDINRLAFNLCRDLESHSETLGDPGWSYNPAFTFDYQSCGPCVFQSALGLLDVGADRLFVCLEQEEWDPLTLIAAVQSKPGQVLLSQFFQGFISTNGSAYGLEIFGSLPTQTTNHITCVLPTDELWECYYRWMESLDKSDFYGWGELEEQLEYVGKNPMEAAFELFGELENSDNHPVDQEGFSPGEKGALLDAYFRNCYETTGGGLTCFEDCPQDPMYGISRKNIVTKLHQRNWRSKAIVRKNNRGTQYVFVREGSFGRDDDKRMSGYFITIHPQPRLEERRHGFERRFDRLDDALAYANGQAGRLGRETVPANEEDYPTESRPGWNIVIGGLRPIVKRK